MSKIDKIDRQIVDFLMQDGRMSCSEIARQIGGITERAVRYRINRLVSGNVIQISAIPKPRALGYIVTADVLLEVESSQINVVAEKLTEFDCVSYVACAIGETDVSLQVVGHNNEEVYTFITEVVGKLPGVRKSTSSIVPVVLKDVYSWRIPRSLTEDDGDHLNS